MLQRTAIALLLAFFLPAAALAQNTVEVTSSISSDTRWTADNEYLLRDFIFVEDGATLTIEPGTVVRGIQQGDNDNTSALIVAQGGTIDAHGTAANPITFTAEGDNLQNPADDPTIGRGAWGGVLILGRAPVTVESDVNESQEGDQFQIEGIPTDETRAQYGGEDPDDDSGTFRYVSIRHGGAILGADNEINGLSMGGVGRGTTIEYVEAIYNLDDGFEFFGGTVDTKHLVAAFCGDDAFDYDQGFVGHGQFWFTIQSDAAAGRGGEYDGGEPAGSSPTSIPVVYNVTYIGPGAGSAENDQGMFFRRNAGGKFYNSVITEFVAGGVNVQDRPDQEEGDSRERLDTGDLALTNNIWYAFGEGNNLQGVAPDYTDSFDRDGDGEDEDVEIPQGFLRTYLDENDNAVEDPQLRGLDRALGDGEYLDPRPQEGSPAFANAPADYPDDDDFFTEADYIGAFGNYNWAADWTGLSQLGILTPETGDRSTSIEQINSGGTGEVPAQVALSQNYPNPFNPSTNIEFELDKAQKVRLTVYDLLGREVAVLVNDVKSAGNYRATFNASNLSSGIYLYRLQTEQGATTKTMTLVK